MRAAAAVSSARVLLAALAGVIAVALVGCGESKNAGGAPLTVDITIAHGQVTPANATLQAAVHQPITLHVTSDVPDELHVHSVPDHKFEVAAAANQTFQFSVDVPGSVDVELHHLDRTIATIHVHP
jgi:hypothetical protein